MPASHRPPARCTRGPQGVVPVDAWRGKVAQQPRRPGAWQTYAHRVLAAHPDGVVVEVWVTPGASRGSVGGIYDGALRVRTSRPAERGAANAEAAELLARHFEVRRAMLIAGDRARRKRFLLVGADLDDASARLPDSAR